MPSFALTVNHGGRHCRAVVNHLSIHRTAIIRARPVSTAELSLIITLAMLRCALTINHCNHHCRAAIRVRQVFHRRRPLLSLFCPPLYSGKPFSRAPARQTLCGMNYLHNANIVHDELYYSRP